MRIATWNVNSIRARIDRVEDFLERHDIDVLAVQETKAREEQIPLMGLQSAGYEVAAAGFNQWNGVAIISRVGIEDVSVGFAAMPEYGDPPAAEARALGAVCGGVRLWSLYVPNGRKVDDPHYVYKLDWLARLRAAASAWAGEPTALVGDWNIAPLDSDVFDIAAFAKDTPRHAAGAGGLRGPSSTTAGATSPGPSPTTRRPTPTGTTTASVTSATAGCASTSRSAPPRWPSASPAPSSTGRSAAAATGTARAPPTTRRWSSTWTEPCQVA